MAEKYILQKNDVESLSDIRWGDGWSQYKKELENTFREITYYGYGLLFLAHSKSKDTDFLDSEGNPIQSTYPDITNTGMNIINRLVDVIAYLSVEFDSQGNSRRYLTTRQTPTVFAGSRYKYLKPKFEFGYQQLIDEIANAIEKEINQGAEVTDHTQVKQQERVPFEQVQAEARALWTKLTENENTANALKIAEIIKSHLGRESRLSEILPNQQDILELIVSDMKDL